MAWKRLRPSALRTVCKSMYIGDLISIFTATTIGIVYLLLSYRCCKTKLQCELHPATSVLVQVQWMRTMLSVIFEFFKHIWFFTSLFLLIRPYQLMRVKRKLVLAFCLGYCLDALYRVTLIAARMSHSKLTSLQKLPLKVLFFISVGWQVHLLTKHLCTRSRRKRITLFLQMTRIFLFPHSDYRSILSFSSLRQGKRRKKTTYCSLFSSHRGRS